MVKDQVVISMSSICYMKKKIYRYLYDVHQSLLLNSGWSRKYTKKKKERMQKKKKKPMVEHTCMHKLIKMQKKVVEQMMTARSKRQRKKNKQHSPSYAFQFNFTFSAYHFLYHPKYVLPDPDADAHFLGEQKKKSKIVFFCQGHIIFIDSHSITH